MGGKGGSGRSWGRAERVPGHKAPSSFNSPAPKEQNTLTALLAAPILVTVPLCDRIQAEKNDVLPLVVLTRGFFGSRFLPCAANTQHHRVKIHNTGKPLEVLKT